MQQASMLDVWSFWFVVADSSWGIEFDERWWLGKKYILKKYKLPSNEPLYFPFSNERMWIEIFDPEFYIDSEKFMTIPRIKFMIQPKTWVQINLKAEYYEMLDRPSKQCKGSSEYSFSKCVKVIYFLRFLRYPRPFGPDGYRWHRVRNWVPGALSVHKIFNSDLRSRSLSSHKVSIVR